MIIAAKILLVMAAFEFAHIGDLKRFKNEENSLAYGLMAYAFALVAAFL